MKKQKLKEPSRRNPIRAARADEKLKSLPNKAGDSNPSTSASGQNIQSTKKRLKVGYFI